MGRKSRDKSEGENLRGIIRQLQSENRQLRKQVARSSKEVQRAVETVNSFVDDVIPEPVDMPSDLISKCIKCGRKAKGLELGPKILYTCTNSNCLHRRTVKK